MRHAGRTKEKSRYNGFNLIVGDTDRLYYYSNIQNEIQIVAPGVHALSNHLLNTAWPKVERGKQALAQVVSTGNPAIAPAPLFELLADRSIPPDDQLPDTGIGPARERLLGPLFITSPTYGTRSSTVLLIDRQRQALFVERTFTTDGQGRPAEPDRHFRLKF